MTLHYLLLLVASPYQLVVWTLTWQKCLDGLINGKWLFTLTSQNKLKKSYSHVSQEKQTVFFFSDIPVTCVDCQKHLGIHLDDKLKKNSKANNGIGIIKELILCEEPYFLQFTGPLLGLTLTTVILFVINPIKKVFVTKQKECSIMQHLELLKQ